MKLYSALLISALLLIGTSCAEETCPTYDMGYRQSARRYKAPKHKTNRMLARSGGHTRIKVNSGKSSKAKSPKEAKTKTKAKPKMAEQE